MKKGSQIDPSDSSVTKFIDKLKEKDAEQTEFLQTVSDVAEDLLPFIDAHPEYQDQKILERITEPERIVIFRVPWMDDEGEYHINRGYRIQMSSAIGPYKGGLRFHPSVNLSILKFLAFEQVFKNSLTGLPMGGGKGGSNFNPKGKSDKEVMRFCQSFMTELFKHIGPTVDVPAGDIGVGGREIGYLFGQYKRLTGDFSGVLTGKGHSFGGSFIRPEATGYGLVYFTQEMLNTIDQNLEGKEIVVSGSGNVAQYTIEKCIEFGAKVITVSDSGGFVYDPAGITREKLAFILDLKNRRRGRIHEYAEEYRLEYFEGQKPWNVKCDVAFPNATQNELDEKDANDLIRNGCLCVAEGANKPSTIEAVHLFHKQGVLYGPGKASNAGGVAVSGLEMSQNSIRYSWSNKEVDRKLRNIMGQIHKKCKKFGKESDGHVNYEKGANIAGFVKVADAMISQGLV